MPVKIDKRIPALVGVSEVAEMHGLTRSGVQFLIDEGELPAVKVGRQWVMRRSVAEGLEVKAKAKAKR